MLVDSHCHLDYGALSEELDAVLARARLAGVGAFLTISTRLDRFPGVLAIAERCKDVWCSVGVHPHEAGSEPDVTTRRLIELGSHPKVVGIGETGLDYHYEHSPRDIQQRSFRTHIAAARETGLPIIVHSRNAEADTARILIDEYRDGAYNGLLHCFSATRQLAEKTLKIDFRISFSGIVTFKNAEEVREVARTVVPLDRLLVETDSPFLAPVPHRGKTNEPAYVAHTAGKVAELRGMPVSELAEATTTNFFGLFTKARRSDQQTNYPNDLK